MEEWWFSIVRFVECKSHEIRQLQHPRRKLKLIMAFETWDGVGRGAFSNYFPYKRKIRASSTLKAVLGPSGVRFNVGEIVNVAL